MTSSWMNTSCTLKLVVVNDCIWQSSESQTRSFLLHKYVKSSHLCCLFGGELSYVLFFFSLIHFIPILH